MKLRNLLSVGFAILFAYSSMAAIVQPEVASNVAKNFMFERLSQTGVVSSINEVSLQLVQTRMSKDLPVFYVFDIDNGGWIIVSGEDIYSPVIGYALEGSFPKGKLDQNYSSFLQEYIDQINFARSNNVVADSKTVNEWSSYNGITGNRNLLMGERDVDPLLDILWNQDFPYNALCPEDPAGPGGHVYVGCVGTAMSMIMYYYRYPEVGIGTHSYNAPGYGTQTVNYGDTYYDWNAMANSITGTMGQSVNAVAELQYHCAVSVNMGFSVNGSGAYSADVPAAIISHFGYASNAQYIQKMSFTLTAWENILITHIDAKKPLYYSGQSSDGGHAFVCDGYQQTGTGNLYHFNFGWSGSGNGFYTLTDVGGFSSQQGMVRNFVPNSTYPYQCDSHIVASPQGSFEDMSGPLETYLPNSGCSWLISPTDSITSVTLTFTDLNLGTGDSIKVYAGYDANAPLLASYGPGASVSALISDTCAMYIQLITDGSEEGDGFRAEFSSTFPVYCTNSVTNLTTQTGEVSDGSGDHNYNNNSVCKWKINPGQWAQNLTLAFTEFDLEQDKDFLKVFDIPTNQLLANLTGDQIPDPIVSSTGQMMLMFSSNGFNNKQGFKADYYISNVNTSEEDFTQNLSIYPNPATSYTDVKFVLKETSNISLTLHNLLGEVVYSESSVMHSGLVSKTLQLNSLSKGVYLLKIAGDNGSVTRKLIIQ